MKRFKSTYGAPLVVILVAITIQGCGGSGGDNDTSNSSAVQNNAQSASTAPVTIDGDVNVHPKAGPAGSTIAVSGRGFADVCGVALFLDTLDGEGLAEATVTDGAFDVQAVVPESAAEGDHTIVGDLLELASQECTQSTGTNFETTFAVNGRIPIITLSLQDGRPGATVDVQGRGFCFDECSPVTLLIDGQVAASGVTVADDGTFGSAAMVPAIDAAGAVAVVALQTDSAGMELRGFGELTVTVRPDEKKVAIP